MLLPISYTGFSEHTRMLNDSIRTLGFIQGIEEVVKPGDVVVDIGTGTGILAIAAAKAGAEKVYAIEASSMGKIAHAHFEASGLAHKISLIPGWSQNITLPEKADVLVSEVVGDDPLCENILQMTAHAKQRNLKPDAILIPSKLRIFGLPITIPPDVLLANTPTIENIKNWAISYNVDFTILGISASQTPHHFKINPSEASTWQPIAEPVLILDVILRETQDDEIDVVRKGIANRNGVLNGLVVFFELEVSPSVKITTHPASVSNECSWRSPVWTIPAGIELKEKDEFEVKYSYGQNYSEMRIYHDKSRNEHSAHTHSADYFHEATNQTGRTQSTT